MDLISSTRLGGSLEVPVVQELAKGSLTQLPERYVHPDQEPPTIGSLPSQIPVIDFQTLILCGDDGANRAQEAAPCLRRLGLLSGNYLLINHGVSFSLVEEVKVGIQEFFKLPLEEKKKFKQEAGDIEGYGQAFVVSEEQKLDWADLFYMVTLPTHLRKPHLFPNLPLPFRNTIEAYSAELKTLAVKILGFMAKALKMQEGEMEGLFEEGMQSMRMNYYPPCPQPELAIGLSPHSDGTGLTIFLQVNEVEGLQIRKDGMWIPVMPLPNAFIVNVGDMLEIVTNGIYSSIEHRAVVCSEERLSIATFLSAKIDGDLGPAPSLLTAEAPARYKRMAVTDFFRVFFSQKLHGKSHLDAMRILQAREGQST
ncbi:Thebaine 6-O-demethylase [Bertholletia excelsa]